MIALAEEDDDCEHWGRWSRDRDLPRLGFPVRWSLHYIIREDHEDTEKLDRDLRVLEAQDYDERRAVAVNERLTGMQRAHGIYRRMFYRLKSAYYWRHQIPEGDILEALRHYRDYKEAHVRRALSAA